MDTTTSADGTTIAYERAGSGPPLIFVGGALSDRAAGESLGAALADRFTVVRYDRRGRGDSGDAADYAVERELDDLDSIIATVGGPAFVYGVSSGAVLCLHAAARGADIARLAVFEPPFVGASPELAGQIDKLVEGDDRSGAVAHFLASIGVPDDVVSTMSLDAMAPMAHTIAYDLAVTGLSDGLVPTERLANVRVPVLVLDSLGSVGSLRDAARSTAEAIPDGTHRSLPGEWHGVDDDVLTDALTEFFIAV